MSRAAEKRERQAAERRMGGELRKGTDGGQARGVRWQSATEVGMKGMDAEGSPSSERARAELGAAERSVDSEESDRVVGGQRG